ncbi:MAG TPA: histidine--tRNA ligase [Candidatus Acidoferrum sp.]
MSEGAAKKEVKPRKFQAIRGTRDLLPPETALWTRVEQTAHEVFTTYGYGEIRPPVFEPTELFSRAVGGDTDIVGKEMYTFVDRLEKLPDPSSLGDYGAFIEQAEKLMDTEELPAVLGNRLAIGRMKEIWDRRNVFRAQDEAPIEKIDQAVLEELYTMVVLKDSMELGQNISLRPEATASVCRAYLEHNMQQLPQPVKLYYMGPMFRRERPQKGRYRQFYQIGAEILGGPDAPAIDAELIEMLMTFFDKCGLQGTELSMNSIGHAADNCRREYVAKLKAQLEKVKDKLGADSQRRIETNPLRVLDSKLEHEQAIIATLPRIADHLCDECKSHYAAVKHELEQRGVIYRENWRLVRGLDYYMRTTFEITAQGLGSQNAVCGGGRYDGLVELLGGPPTKGIGFAIGEDRLILSLQEQEKAKAVRTGEMSGAITGKASVTGTLSNLSAPGVFIAWMGERAYATAIRAAKDLRNAGFRVELPATELKFGKALERASKLGSRFALILGDNEVAEGQWTLKNLADGSQQKLTDQALLEYLRGL